MCVIFHSQMGKLRHRQKFSLQEAKLLECLTQLLGLVADWPGMCHTDPGTECLSRIW